MPLYPTLPRMAAIQGRVVLRVTTDGEKVAHVKVEEGQFMLAKAAEENVKTWHFTKHTPTFFTATFAYHLDYQTGCASISPNDRVVLNLPTEIEITGTRTIPADCDPNAGLDLAEPLRVSLTRCEVDGASVPCQRVRMTLTGNGLVITPERFKERDGREGFVVPSAFRKFHTFGVVVKTPKGSFSVRDIHGNFLGQMGTKPDV